MINQGKDWSRVAFLYLGSGTENFGKRSKGASGEAVKSSVLGLSGVRDWGSLREFWG
jgi:hypothetical protein